MSWKNVKIAEGLSNPIVWHIIERHAQNKNPLSQLRQRLRVKIS